MRRLILAKAQRRKVAPFNSQRPSTPVSSVGEIRELPQRRLKEAKKRRLNAGTNAQQSQPSLRDWIIIPPQPALMVFE